MTDRNARPGVTFIGVGAIGLPMVERIARAGFRVSAVEPGEPQRERAAAAGLDVVPSLAQAELGEIAIVMVATPAQLESVIDAALARGDAGSALWVLMSTVGPDSVRTAAERLAAVGGHVVDAPVTGGVSGARAGTLRLFCAGDPALIESARAVLECCGVVETVGEEPGRGQAVKVINQHLCSVHLVAAGEALALAESLGLDRAEVLRLVEQGAAGSWMLSDRGPRMIEPVEQALSTIGIFVKDSGLVAEAARAAGADVPVLEAARERFLAAERAGLGGEDDSRVHDTYRTGR